MKTSATIGEILPALVKSEGEFGPLHKKGKNEFLKAKYLVLDDLLDEIKPILSANGIFLIQPFHTPDVERQVVAVTTRFWHIASGEFLEIESAAPYGDEKGISLAQSMGKVITYQRRYQLVSFFALATEDDTDAQPGAARAQAAKPQAPARPSGPDPAAEFTRQWQRLFDSKETARLRLEEILKAEGLTWGQVSGDAAWLQKTYSDEAVAAAAARESDLEAELAEIAAGIDNDKPF